MDKVAGCLAAIIIAWLVIASLATRENRFSIYQNLENNLFKSSHHTDVVWLLKDSPIAHSRIALFFGYSDNHTSCNEFAELYNKEFPEVHYYCKKDDI
ncbi:MAG: hypothetical protein KBA75_06855 [Alphaproteobacteria bacterium]|nr:hypothetical protein [Alphaproteobacteria bacterium]